MGNETREAQPAAKDAEAIALQIAAKVADAAEVGFIAIGHMMTGRAKDIITNATANAVLTHISALCADRDAAAKAMGDWTADDIAELRRMIPKLDEVLSWNPLSQVAFRAGLLACRETMARFVEQGGSEEEKRIAISIRANWWPKLGDDPGPPRQLRYDEIADEKPDGSIGHKDMSPSVEALPRALAFINGASDHPVIPVAAAAAGEGKKQ